MNRDALARAIWRRQRGGDMWGFPEGGPSFAHALADALLPLVAAAEDGARADAWDEGVAAHRDYDYHDPPLANPYRAALSDAERAAPPADEPYCGKREPHDAHGTGNGRWCNGGGPGKFPAIARPRPADDRSRS